MGADPVIRVLLVDDDHLMRAGLTMIIEQADDLVVVNQAEDGGRLFRWHGGNVPTWS